MRASSVGCRLVVCALLCWQMPVAVRAAESTWQAATVPTQEDTSDAELHRRLEGAEHEIHELRDRLEELTSSRQWKPSSDRTSADASEQEESDVVSASYESETEFGQPLLDLFAGGDRPGLAAPWLLGSRFEGEFGPQRIGTDFYSPPKFEKGIVIEGIGAVMKIGGFVKADLIHDFNPIDTTDVFDTREIPVGAPQRENSRFHARQSRLSFDTRWLTDLGPVRTFVEGDFFSEGDHLRLRHAYGELGRVIVGQTWTTFTDMRSLPTTLDFEGATSAVTRRQAQIRWTQPTVVDGLRLAVALENPQTDVEDQILAFGEPRTESPDLVAHLRYSTDFLQLQVAAVARDLGFQPFGKDVATAPAWGWNFTGYLELTEQDAAYFQILFGDGIGSYRGLPDVAQSGPNDLQLLTTFAWMIGAAHNWTDNLSSNFTYSVNSIDNIDFQAPESLRVNTYLALNLIWNPTERFFVGVEYLYGTRENKDGQRAHANRLQSSFGFYLP